MSDVKVLHKEQVVHHNTTLYENYNNIHDKPVVSDDIFINEFIPKHGKFKNHSIKTDEETFVSNYGNLFASVDVKEKTLIISETDDKVSLKINTYYSSRSVTKRYFRVRREITYLTFNFKKKIFYSGTLNLKKKVKISSQMQINKTDLNDMSIINRLGYFFETYNHKFAEKIVDIFLDRIIEKMGIKLEINGFDKREKYYNLFLKICEIKYPDAFFKFVTYYTPKNEIKKHGNNLVTWFMKKQGFKGTKIRNLLNKYNNVDLDGINFFYKILGIDLFNKVDDSSFLTDSLLYVSDIKYEDYKITKKEKENIVSILNTTTSNLLLNTLIDHIEFKHKLKKYGEDVKISKTNYHDYTTEHLEWSKLIRDYSTGIVNRDYGDEAYLIEKPITYDKETYYPVLLTTTEQYDEESFHQSNCVRTYSDKPYCLIISLRKGDKAGEERATIEFQFRRNVLVRTQTLGKYNVHLSEEWLSPINQLTDFATYLYSKEVIKLPTMVKKYGNGKIINFTSKFEDHPDIYRLTPIWDKEKNNDYLLDHIPDYYPINYDDELF